MDRGKPVDCSLSLTPIDFYLSYLKCNIEIGKIENNKIFIFILILNLLLNVLRKFVWVVEVRIWKLQTDSRNCYLQVLLTRNTSVINN